MGKTLLIAALLKYHQKKSKDLEQKNEIKEIHNKKNKRIQAQAMFKKLFEIQVIKYENERMYANHSTFHGGDSGLDLFVTEDTMILPQETKLVGTGIKCQSVSFNPCVWQWFSTGFYKHHSYLLFPRSSISKTPLIMKNSIGLIDAGYTGEIKAALHNTSSEPFYLKRGERFVQLVNSDLSPVKFKLVPEVRKTTRGDGGFGSTGLLFRATRQD